MSIEVLTYSSQMHEKEENFKSGLRNEVIVLQTAKS